MFYAMKQFFIFFTFDKIYSKAVFKIRNQNSINIMNSYETYKYIWILDLSKLFRIYQIKWHKKYTMLFQILVTGIFSRHWK